MKKGRRRNYLVDRSLQLRYMGMVAILMVVISIITGWVIYATTWITLIDKLKDKVLLEEVFIDLNKPILIKTSLLVLVGTTMGALLTMFVVQRVAGPLSRVKEIMREIAKGIVPHRVRFRRGDEFQELAEAVDEAICKIGEDSERNLKVIKEASACVGRGIEWLNSEEPQVQRLKEELEHLRKCLERFEIFQKQLSE